MSLALFNAVPAGAIEILYDEQNQPWFKRAHVGKFLEITHIHTSLEGLDERETCTRSNFRATCRSTASSVSLWCYACYRWEQKI